MRVKKVSQEVLDRVSRVKHLLDPAILHVVLEVSTEEAVSLLSEAIEGAMEGYSIAKSQLFSSVLLLGDIPEEDQRKSEAEYLKEVLEEYQFFKSKMEMLQAIYDSIVQVPTRKRIVDAPLRVILESEDGA